jgi:hypothetical protein
LRLGVETQAEQSLSGVAGPLVIAQSHGEVQRHRFALLHDPLVERGDGIDHCQRFIKLSHLQVQLSLIQP